MDPEIKAALDKLFSGDSSLYQTRGFQRRIGWGEKPALINIDLANAWTRENNAFTCEGMDTVIPAVQQVHTPSLAGRRRRQFARIDRDRTVRTRFDVHRRATHTPVQLIRHGENRIANHFGVQTSQTHPAQELVRWIGMSPWHRTDRCLSIRGGSHQPPQHLLDAPVAVYKLITEPFQQQRMRRCRPVET